MYNIRTSSLIIIIFGLALMLLAGLKPIGIDRDSFNYVNMIQASISYEDLYLREPAFNAIQILNNILFNKSTTTFFLIFAVLGVSLKIIAILRASLYPILSLAIYVFFYYILHDFTQIRVGVASALFLLAVNDRINDRKSNALIKIFAAICFHYSAVLAFVIFMVNTKRLNRLFYLMLPILGITATLILNANVLSYVAQYLPGFLSSKINAYLYIQKNDALNQINVFNFYYSTLFIIYCSIIVFIGDSVNTRDILYLKVLGLGLFCFYSMAFIPVMAFRTSEFYCIVIIILFANLASYFKQPIIYKICIVVFGLGYFITQGLMHNVNI
ncbi:EpsG family protein [Lelliottia nimipressuralis]